MTNQRDIRARVLANFNDESTHARPSLLQNAGDHDKGSGREWLFGVGEEQEEDQLGRHFGWWGP
jgi:hypothetical protein